jgi:putative ABC transport system ATP-binding protein
MTMTVMLAKNLYRFYHTKEEETLALKGISLEIVHGEFVAVRGPSGSGKSTLLSCLAGLDEPDGGFVAVCGVRITRKSESVRAAIRARLMGIMLQSGNLFDHLTVEENIRVHMHLARSRDKHRLEELITQIGIDGIRHAQPEQLSGGQTALAAIAVAMSSRPSVILADEPTGEVDAQTELRLLDLLDAYRRTGPAVLVVTHSRAVAERADRTIDLFDGRISNE